MNTPIAFGARVRSRTTHLEGYFVTTTKNQRFGYAHHLVDTYHDGTHTPGFITIVLRDDLEILRPEPTADDIAATNAGLAAYAARQCNIKVGDTVVYHRWDKTKEGQIFKVEILCTVAQVMPVFNSTMRNSFRVTATCPPESEMEALEADESFFTRIEERLAQCS